MYCDNCGCELGENVRKCPVCGKEFPLIEPEVDDSTTVLTSEPDVDEDDDSNCPDRRNTGHASDDAAATG